MNRGASAGFLTELAQAKNSPVYLVDVYFDSSTDRMTNAPKNITPGALVTSGTAQAGAASSLTLAVGANETADFYAQNYLRIVSGTGAGQARGVKTSRKNLKYRSESVSYWGVTNLSYSAAPITLGGLPAGRLTLTGGLVVHSFAAGINSPAVGRDYWHSFSIDISGLGLKKISVELGGGVGHFTWTGPQTITTTTSGGATAVYDILGDYQAILRVKMVNTANANNLIYLVYYGGAYSGDGQYIDVTRAQLEDITDVPAENYVEYIHTESLAAVGVAVSPPWNIIPDATSVYQIYTPGGNTYYAFGHFLNFSGLSETEGMNIPNVTMQLSGVDQAWIAVALATPYLDRRIVISKTFIDDSGGITVAPVVIFDGRMDGMAIADNPGSTSTVSITATNQFADFNFTPGRHTNMAEQQAHFPGDMFFEYSSSVALDITWGTK
jgi:hypothetical protein